MTRLINKALVEELEAPDKGQLIVFDSKIPGFGVRVTPPPSFRVARQQRPAWIGL